MVYMPDVQHFLNDLNRNGQKKSWTFCVFLLTIPPPPPPSWLLKINTFSCGSSQINTNSNIKVGKHGNGIIWLDITINYLNCIACVVFDYFGV